jgi:hypothetical protein
LEKSVITGLLLAKIAMNPSLTHYRQRPIAKEQE